MGVLGAKALTLVLGASSLCQAQLMKEEHLVQMPLVRNLFATSATSSVLSQEYLLGANSSQKYYAYTSKDFADGRGISIITTPDRIKLFENLSPPPPVVNNNNKSPPFEIKELPGKGRGIIANKTLYRGDLIFAYTPVLLIDIDMLDEENLDNEELAQEAIDQLPMEAQKKFWNLHRDPDKSATWGRIRSNMFDLDISDDQYGFMGVFPETSYANHDCRPNAGYFFDDRTLTHYVMAATEIAPGTEISITYINVLFDRHSRGTMLEDTWGFKCSCSSCTQTEELSRVSDQRLEVIENLSERLADDGWKTASSQMAETLLSLHAQERIHIYDCDAFRAAALTHCAEGNYWETVRHAWRAAEECVLENGSGDALAVTMRDLARSPMENKCWMRKVTGEMGEGD